MSDDRDHTIATATVTSEEKPYGVRIDAKTPVTRGVRAGTEIRTTAGIR